MPEFTLPWHFENSIAISLCFSMGNMFGRDAAYMIDGFLRHNGLLIVIIKCSDHSKFILNNISLFAVSMCCVLTFLTLVVLETCGAANLLIKKEKVHQQNIIKYMHYIYICICYLLKEPLLLLSYNLKICIKSTWETMLQFRLQINMLPTTPAFYWPVSGLLCCPAMASLWYSKPLACLLHWPAEDGRATERMHSCMLLSSISWLRYCRHSNCICDTKVILLRMPNICPWSFFEGDLCTASTSVMA